MSLLSNFFRRKAGGQAAPADAAASVQEARTKARHRLIGAVVLLLVGIIGFPLVFETQPRPIPVDITIEIPRKDGAPPLVAPAPQTPARAPATATPVPPVRGDRALAAPVPTTPAAAAPAGVPATAPSRPGEPGSPSKATRPVAEPPPVAARTAAPPKPAPAPADPAGARFVVQIGAFADASSARSMRARAEKLGMKTYTQVVDTTQGSRIRVRIGPFASRESAEQALAKAKAAGLNAVVLTL
jgi:DedD protein